jgi:hypothetical protein
MDNILKQLKILQIKLKALFCKEEEHLIVQLTPHNISFQHMRGKRVVDTVHAAFSRRQKLLNQLNDFDLPIQLILKDWDLKVRQLDLSRIKFLDRLHAKKNFIAGEFSAQDTVICKKSSMHKNTYTIIGLQHNYQLDQVLNSIATLNKTIKKIQLFETEILHKIRRQYANEAEKHPGRLFALLTESNKRWQLLVGHHDDLIYSRFLEQSPSKHFQNDLIQDVMDTINYLSRLGVHTQQPLMLFAKKGLFQNAPEVKKHNMHLMSIMNMNDFLILDEKKTGNFYSLFSWVNDSISLPNFFWNRLSYVLPKLSVLILLPLVFILGMLATYLSIHTAIYLKKIDSIEKKIQDFSSCHLKMNTDLQNSKYFSFFQTHYQQNPILMLKNITKLTVNYMNMQAVHWIKHDQNFVLDCTFVSKKNLSQKKINTIQQKITHRSPQKIQHLSFYSSNADNAKIISLNVRGSE